MISIWCYYRFIVRLYSRHSWDAEAIYIRSKLTMVNSWINMWYFFLNSERMMYAFFFTLWTTILPEILLRFPSVAFSESIPDPVGESGGVGLWLGLVFSMRKHFFPRISKRRSTNRKYVLNGTGYFDVIFYFANVCICQQISLKCICKLFFDDFMTCP